MEEQLLACGACGDCDGDKDGDRDRERDGDPDGVSLVVLVLLSP